MKLKEMLGRTVKTKWCEAHMFMLSVEKSGDETPSGLVMFHSQPSYHESFFVSVSVDQKTHIVPLCECALFIRLLSCRCIYNIVTSLVRLIPA